MSVQAALSERMKAAMKAGDKEQVSALRFIISELQKAAKDARAELSADDEIKVLQRERKKRVESIEAFRAGGRDDLVHKEEYELGIIEALLPKRLDEAELGALVDEAIAEVGASSPKEMGKVMSLVMAKGGVQVDGKLASRLVKERLSP